MIILLFIESRLNFKNIPLNLTFKSSSNYEYIVYRNENPISCFLEFLVSLNRKILYSRYPSVACAWPSARMTLACIQDTLSSHARLA